MVEEDGAPCRIEHGDSLHLMKKLPDRSIGAVISDPPFFCGIGRDDGGAGKDPWVGEEANNAPSATTWCRPYAREFARTVRPGGSVALMGGAHANAAWMTTMEEVGFIWMAELTILWNTGKPRVYNFGSLTTHIEWFAAPGAPRTWNSPRKSLYSNVLIATKIPPKFRHHAAQKPIELTTFLISLLTRDSDLVFDPFTGSGSTLVSARICGRNSLGFDKVRENVDIARSRVSRWEVEEEGKLYFWRDGRAYEV